MKILRMLTIMFLLASLQFSSQQAHVYTVQEYTLSSPEYNTWIPISDFMNSIVVQSLSEDFYGAEVEINYEPTVYRLIKNTEKDTFTEILITHPIHALRIRYTGNIIVHLYKADTTPPPSPLLASTANTLNIISRKEWGADESYRYDTRVNPPQTTSSSETATGECGNLIKLYPDEYRYSRVVYEEHGNKLLWPFQYSHKIQKIVLHHTAESEQSSQIEGAQKIRSIYHYHAKTRRWGDIGYHYIIDQDGKIYEGRAGGDYVVSGHAFCSNVNTIGIALMGNL